MEYEKFVPQEKANKLFQAASLIVTHAGMGSVLTGLKYRKPIVIVPRKASLGEHRNDHQLATAKWLASRPGIQVVWEEGDIVAALDNYKLLQKGMEISDYASPELLTRLNNFILR
jgi:UDP-N-acetylglucosamine transferase subunit ALG13